MHRPKTQLRIAKYRHDEDDKNAFLRIKHAVTSYFDDENISKYADKALIIKGFLLFFAALASFSYIFFAQSFFSLAIALFGAFFLNLILAMTIGHDAAHRCLTGQKSRDNFIFQFCFIINGINPTPWRDKHNMSHHSFPNVQEYDSDLELSHLIVLTDAQQRRPVHRFQHLYAPFLYSFFTLAWIYYYDFIYNFKTYQGNLTMRNGWRSGVKMLFIKTSHILLFLIIPMYFTSFLWYQILMAYIAAHFVISLFLSFTFFMSHHVEEAHYAKVADGNKISDTWLHHQLATTVDFHAESRLANIIFGGFNAHVAHHLFPNVSHAHYPALTRIIKPILNEEELPYKSVSFFRGIISHLKLLKHQGAL